MKGEYMFCPKCGTKLQDNVNLEYCTQCGFNVAVIRNEINDNVVLDGNYDSITLNTSTQGQASPVDFNKVVNKEKQNPSIDQELSRKLSFNARPENIMWEARKEATKQGLLIQDYLKKKGLTKSQIEKLMWESAFNERKSYKPQQDNNMGVVETNNNTIDDTQPDYKLPQENAGLQTETIEDKSNAKIKVKDSIVQIALKWAYYAAIFTVLVSVNAGIKVTTKSEAGFVSGIVLGLFAGSIYAIISGGVIFIVVWFFLCIKNKLTNPDKLYQQPRPWIESFIPNKSKENISFLPLAILFGSFCTAILWKTGQLVKIGAVPIWLITSGGSVAGYLVGKTIAEKLNTLNKPKKTKTLSAWGAGIVGFCLYIIIHGFVIDTLDPSYYKNKYQHQKVSKSPSNEINYVPSVNEQPVKVVPERNELFEAWNKQNPWYGHDSEMTQYADSIGNKRQNEPLAEILRKIDEAMRQRWPERFDRNNRKDSDDSRLKSFDVNAALTKRPPSPSERTSNVRTSENMNPNLEAWEKNNPWYGYDPEMTKYADSIAVRYKNAPSLIKVLQKIDEAMRWRWPERFDKSNGSNLTITISKNRITPLKESYLEQINFLNDSRLNNKERINQSINYDNSARYKESLGRYVEAIEDLNKAIKLNPSQASFYSKRGFVKHQLNDKLGAIRDYTTAIELEPQNALFYYNRAVAREVLGGENNLYFALKDYYQAATIDNSNITYAISYNKVRDKVDGLKTSNR
jgi:tetratricopeptide (TPR) repeat protein